MSFDDVKNFLSNISSIHQGGCAISALAMKRWLKANQNIEAEIVYAFNENPFFTNNKTALEKNDYSLTDSCSHAGIKLPNSDKVIDARMTWSSNSYEEYLTIPEEFVIESLKKFARWNYMFSRSHVWNIAKTLGIDLSDVPIKM